MNPHELRIALAAPPGPVPHWALALAQRLANEPSGLSWAGCRALPNTIQPTLDSPVPEVGRVGRRILEAIDRPRFRAYARAPSSEPSWPPAAITGSGTAVDVLITFGLADLPAPASLPAAGLQLCVLDRQLPGQIDRALLAGHGLLRLTLFVSGESALFDTLMKACGRVLQPPGGTIDRACPPAWRRLDSHALPAQSFSRSDLLVSCEGALPEFVLSRLRWLSGQLATARLPDASATMASMGIKRTELDDAEAPHGGRGPRPAMGPMPAMGLYLRWLRERVRQRTRDEQWQLRVHHHDPRPDRMDRPLHRYARLIPPAGTLWADPHVINHDGEAFVFMETLDFRDNRGRIAVAKLGQEGFQAPPVDVLDEPCHLSYPFVFEHEGHHWMVPETATRREVSLYRAHAFPYDWRRERVLMQGADLADCTLWRHEGRWWLFANGISHPAVDERDLLLLFYTDDFRQGHWTPHPMNPVLTGVDQARMAGPLFEHEGELYRPCQFGARRYGFGCSLARIEVLNPSEYRETPITRLTPLAEPTLLGVHSYCRGHSVTLIDVLQARPRHRQALR